MAEKPEQAPNPVQVGKGGAGKIRPPRVTLAELNNMFALADKNKVRLVDAVPQALEARE